MIRTVSESEGCNISDTSSRTRLPYPRIGTKRLSSTRCSCSFQQAQQCDRCYLSSSVRPLGLPSFQELISSLLQMVPALFSVARVSEVSLLQTLKTFCWKEILPAKLAARPSTAQSPGPKIFPCLIPHGKIENSSSQRVVPVADSVIIEIVVFLARKLQHTARCRYFVDA